MRVTDITIANENLPPNTAIEIRDDKFIDPADSEKDEKISDSLQLTDPDQNLITHSVHSDDADSSLFIADATQDCPPQLMRRSRALLTRSIDEPWCSSTDEHRVKPKTGTGRSGNRKGHHEPNTPDITPTVRPFISSGELNIDPSLRGLRLKKICPPGPFDQLMCSSGLADNQLCSDEPYPICVLNNCERRKFFLGLEIRIFDAPNWTSQKPNYQM